MVLSSMKKLRKDKVKLVAPRLFNSPIRGRGKVQAYRELRNRLRFLRYGLLLGNYGLVTNKLLSLQFAASDVVLIQRKKVLNSGNLPMGFYFGKVVVGPDRGNVGEILRETGNPVFDPDDENSVARAVREAFTLAEQGKGEENRLYAEKNWSPDICARAIVQAYEQALKDS
jgi:glycosyltransferase involved in cell wall biosynthesis